MDALGGAISLAFPEAEPGSRAEARLSGPFRVPASLPRPGKARGARDLDQVRARRPGCSLTKSHVKLCPAAQRGVMSATIYLASGRRWCRPMRKRECGRGCPETSTVGAAAVAGGSIRGAGRQRAVPDGRRRRQDQCRRAGALRVDGGPVCRRSTCPARRAARSALAVDRGFGPLRRPVCSPATACRAQPPIRGRTTGSAAGRATEPRSCARAPAGLPAQRQRRRA